MRASVSPLTPSSKTMRSSLWRTASLLLLSSICTQGSIQQLQLPPEYSKYAHPGLARDFQSMLIQQEQDQQLLLQNRNDGYDPAYDDDSILRMRSLQNDVAFCYDALYLADQNKDSRVEGDEFITFIQIMGPPGFLSDAETYNDLPLIMQSNFIILACLCLQIPGSSPQCCTNSPHIDNTGTWPGQVPTTAQQQYLYQVCFLTQTSIDRVIESQTPTLSPQEDPTSDPPAPPPFVPPVDAPTTAAPSAGPPIIASQEPTIDVQTEAPSVVTAPTVPSVAPTNATEAPTPFFVITGAPSVAPPTTTTMPPSLVNETLAPTDFNETSAPTPLNETIAPPVDRPTVRPPSPTRTPVDSLQPSIKPPLVSDQVVSVNYNIALRNGNVATIDSATYIPSLMAALDSLAEVVEESWNAKQLLQEQEEAGAADQEAAIDGSNDQQVDEATFSRVGPIDEGDAGNRNLRRGRSNQQASQIVVDNLRRPQRRRRLAIAVEVDLPTNVVGTIEDACPTFVPDSDSCQNVVASVPLIVYLTGDDASEETGIQVRNSFQQEMDTAISEGRLQDALEQIDPSSPAYVTTGTSEVPPPSVLEDDVAPTEEKSSGPDLGPGGIAGIAAGAGCVMLLAGILLSSRNRPKARKRDDDEELLKDAEDKATAQQLSKDIAAADAQDYDDEPDPDFRGGTTNAAITGGALGAAAAVAAVSSSHSSSQREDIVTSTPSSPGKKKRFSTAALYEVPGTKNITSDEGSSAGESGWSSNQDMSSVDSKSLDSGAGQIHAGVGGAAVLAGAAGVAAMSRSGSSSRGNTAEDLSIAASRDYSADASLQSTYSELDDAIQKGDWAAVGVTAALLASQSHDDGSTQGSRPRINKKASLNPQRAAELDALVEAGDWEGVVAAAARFDAQEALRGESTLSGGGSTQSRSLESPSGAGSIGGSSIGTGPSNMSTSGTLESTTSPSTFTGANTATSDTASTRSKARKLNEIREEVEALVNTVVPEEADNVDEMMTQFRGREEELVETLRSMQERQVAQKARLESQKQAKRSAKAFVENQKQQEKFGAIDNTGSPADDKWMADIEESDPGAPVGETAAANIPGLTTSMVDDAQKEKETKQQLKEAIEKEDWNTVAAAAAGLSGHGIFQDDDEDTRDSVLEAASTASGRSFEMNALVDRGDWDGVVAAASRYVDVDSRKTSVTDESTSIEERRRKRQERLKEEEEALAQAEIWDAIAEQTKAENAEEEERASNAGANLAAAWAIDRSLTALRKAETDKSEHSIKKTDEGGEV